MQIQNSFATAQKGKLYIVPTPIGNLDDMTYRAVEVLRSVDLIAAEDTRHTQKLLNHFQIKKRLISFHEHNVQTRIPQLLIDLEEGQQIALVSDAGMPAISDPGYELVAAAIAKEIPVITLPGANAALCALVSSGLPTENFLFLGFLPRKKQEKRAALEKIKQQQATLIIYESPNRVKDTLVVINEVLGNRQVTLARELTKVYEQYIRGTVAEVLEHVATQQVKGECVLVIAGAREAELILEESWWHQYSLLEHVKYYEARGHTHKEALKLVAQDRGLTKRDVYKYIHVDKNE